MQWIIVNAERIGLSVIDVGKHDSLSQILWVTDQIWIRDSLAQALELKLGAKLPIIAH